MVQKQLNDFFFGSLKSKKITNEIIEPKINGIDKNKNIVAVYIGCLTIPYKPFSITF